MGCITDQPVEHVTLGVLTSSHDFSRGIPSLGVGPSDPSESLLLVRANHVGAFTRAWRPRTTPERRRSPRLWHTGRAIDPTAIEATLTVPDRAGLLFFVDGVHQFNPTFPVRVDLINDPSGPKSCGFGGCGGTQRGLSLGPTAEAVGFRLHSVIELFARGLISVFSG
jgi:hypothetical protein